MIRNKTLKNMNRRLGPGRLSTLIGAIAVLAVVGSSCASSIRAVLLPRLIKAQENYLGAERFQRVALDQIKGPVYSFQWYYYRNLVVKTTEGWIIVDPINPGAARLLKAELEKNTPGLPVHTLIYSHYHLDHTRGGAILKPRTVLAHADCVDYWQQTDSRNVLAPNKTIRGDLTLKTGGVNIRLMYLGRSHTDTLYAFYMPEQQILHTVDLGLVRTFFPTGHPDTYMPGAIAAMERLARLEFEIFIPGHFDSGTKADFPEYLAFQRDMTQIAQQALEKHGAGEGSTIPPSGEEFYKLFADVYEPLKKKYGHWHGFDQQGLYTALRNILGANLGF